MIFAIKHEDTMAYVEAGNPLEALTLVNMALGSAWTRADVTVDKLLRGTVIVTESEKNMN